MSNVENMFNATNKRTSLFLVGEPAVLDGPEVSSCRGRSGRPPSRTGGIGGCRQERRDRPNLEKRAGNSNFRKKSLILFRIVQQTYLKVV